MKTVILVIGRSGAGKDTIVRELQKKFDIPSIASYTDRPMRPTETNGVEHTFLTKDKFDNVMKKENVVAYTKIGETGYRYCATTELLEKTPSDKLFYIIDPTGYKYIKDSGKFKIITAYIDSYFATRMLRALERNKNQEDFERRSVAEYEQFDKFEHEVTTDIVIHNNGNIFDAVDAFEKKLAELLK